MRKYGLELSFHAGSVYSSVSDVYMFVHFKVFFLQKLRHYTCAANVPTKPEQHCSGGSPAEDSKYLPDYTTH